MIIFTDRNYETLAVADSDTPNGLQLIDDELNESIATGAAIYQARIAKTHETVENIASGNFVFVPNFRGRTTVLEIMEVEETHGDKKIIAEDAGLELLNSDTGALKMKGTLADFVDEIIGEDSEWEIGTNEIDPKKSLTLEYTGVTNQTKRLVEVAARFGAEISYSFDFYGNRVRHKYINFHYQRGTETGVRLEVGKELKDVTRHVSITELCTAIRGIGQPHKETVKQEKTVKETIKVPSGGTSSSTTTTTVQQKPEDNPTLKKFIGWYQQRKGKVSYSMYNRMGPNSYDCSSALTFAAKSAGLLPKNAPIGSTETLYGYEGKYLQEIKRSEIRYGDMFISGVKGASLGAAGHTGAVLNKNQIIHCTPPTIKVTSIDGWTGTPVHFYRWKNVKLGTTTQTTAEKKQYWTNSDVTKHDLAWRLYGLTAAQLNNWIKASNSKSPFNGQGQVFIEAQVQSGLDARYILAHAALESAWGTSNIARKYNNYFGIGAFDTNPENAKNYSNPGLAAGIIQGAKWIAKNYYNGQYKQRTLYSMRHNNGVHQYATDPDWDKKIARIMKQSERYTKPNIKDKQNGTQGSGSQKPATTTKTVEKKVMEDVEVDKDTNLIGYDYDDGRYFVDKETGTLCDREANKLWAKPNKKEKYVVRVYDSQATSQKTLFDECMRQLQANNEPQVTYDVSPEDIPDQVMIGDTIRIIDHDYSPALYLDARLVEVTTSTVNDIINHAKFANFVERSSGIDTKLIELQDMIQSQKYQWDTQPYLMRIESTNGSTFKDNVLDTELIAYVTRAGIDQSAYMDGFIWERHSEYPDLLKITDEEWNTAHEEMIEHTLPLTSADVEQQATFTCSAMIDGLAVAVATYTIKNLRIGVYRQKEEPDRNLVLWGDRWVYEGDDETPAFDRLWKNGRWEDTITKRDLDDLELEGIQGPPGKDGEDGLPGPPGKDGQSSYTHFAYADSADGTIGFTRTATNGKKYIGVYADFEQADSTDPTKYAWSLFKGEDGTDGIPGKPGADGRTPYFHQAWANSEDGHTDFSISDSTDKKYLGTLTDFTQDDSANPDDYQWMLIKGKDGVDGKDGKPGKDGQDGEDGQSAYEIAKTHGFKGTEAEWLETLKGNDGLPGKDGENGLPGKDGKDGKPSYTHFAYADNIYGTSGFTTTFSASKKYIGSYVDSIEADSTNPSDYHWSKYIGEDGAQGARGLQGLQGPKGDQGIPGKNGSDGQSSYTHIAYANSSDGYTSFSLSDSNREYIGVYVDSNKTDSNRPLDYKWSLIKGRDGQDGIPGKAGVDGRTPYIHIAWANSADGSSGFSISNSGGKSYMGVLTDYTKGDSTNYRDYTWSLFKGDKGDQGVPGKDGAKGQTAYFHTAYANSSDGKTDFSISDSTGRSYVGTYSDHTAADSTDPTKYKWIALVDDALREEIASKADGEALTELQSKQQELEVEFQLLPSADDLKQNLKAVEQQKAYIQQIENAIESDKLSLEDRIKIIEANVGAGKLSIEAIQTYLNFGEEGVEIGKKDEQVKVFIANDALEIVDGGKTVARFANNQADMVNARVSGTFEFGYHLATKFDQNGRYTVISPL